MFGIPVSAFIIVFILTLLQSYHYLGNWDSVLHEIFFNINKRIGLEKNLAGYAIYNESMNASYIDTILIYLKLKPLFGETVSGLKSSFFDYTNFIGVVYIGVILNAKNIFKQKSKTSLLIVSILSMMAPLSWYVLGKPHSFWHSHINAILLFVPTIFLQAVLLSVSVKDIGYMIYIYMKLIYRKTYA